MNNKIASSLPYFQHINQLLKKRPAFVLKRRSDRGLFTNKCSA